MRELGTVPRRASSDRRARWAGLLVGLVAARPVGSSDSLGVGILYAIPVFGLCAVAGLLVGEVLTAPPQGAVRTAGLAPRRIRDYVPPRMTLLLLAEAAALVILLTVAAVVASPDGMGRTGRSVSVSCPDGGTATSSPWPGLFYGLPVLAALALSTTACIWSLARIVRRPGIAPKAGVRR
ncbi:hypothetical protein ACIPSE_12290 [Streptomyces sp. NPDC090106]|uniref:hypothetical protein n=1 Tax=Streptomyces sp. NPDC090106 TaxID=3365946 RepID=UPI0037F98323